MSRSVRIGSTQVGDGEPCFIVAEIGINHNGEIAVAKQLIDAAKEAGANAVKFQKRTPDQCVPPEQRNVIRETPWGSLTYLEYRYKVEFDLAAYEEIDRHCKTRGIMWFASCWDEESVSFMEQLNPPCYKIPSAALTDDALLRHHHKTGRPIILSTGMSTMEQIRHAVRVLDTEQLVILHCTSTYPSPPGELNLRTIRTLAKEFPNYPIGYSGHEVGLQTSLAAVALGACCIERHITVDRAMWGTDQAASVEPQGFTRLVRDIRVIERALGDGVKRVYDSELPIMARLRRVSQG
jgi:N-acetylneuraminate synthase